MVLPHTGVALKPPSTPARIQIKTFNLGFANEWREVGRHVGHPRPLTVNLNMRKEGEHVEHVRRQGLREVERRAR